MGVHTLTAEQALIHPGQDAAKLGFRTVNGQTLPIDFVYSSDGPTMTIGKVERLYSNTLHSSHHQDIGSRQPVQKGSVCIF